MTERKDIVDGKTVTSSTKFGLVYTCKCGWVDVGHANPLSIDPTTGAANLWQAINNESGSPSPNGLWHQVTYKQAMAKKMGPIKPGDDVTKSFAVRVGLSRPEKESVALSILLNVSIDFERLQGKYALRSAFSSEDLPSNIIGFYWAVTGTSPIPQCQPVSKSAAEKIWDNYKGPTSNMYKIRSIRTGDLPKIMLFPCTECKDAPYSMYLTMLPAFLSTIRPLPEGSNLFRLWNDSDPELTTLPAGPQQPPQHQPVRPTAPMDREVTVQRGESLSIIAGREYGDLFFWPLIWEANRSIVGTNANLIHAGMKLRIPAKSSFNSNQIESAKRLGRNRTVPIAPNR